MRIFFLLFVALARIAPTAAQQLPATSSHATERRVNDLVHTKLDVRFDYARRYLYGRALLTFKPHGYATDTLRLDAKGMDIQKVGMGQSASPHSVTYDYNGRQLLIHLGRMIPAGEAYTIYINYTAKPDELGASGNGSAAIRGAKGLYFINPDSAVSGKPVQIWTQGETDANSAWFPTIDQPNQKTTDEISMTVPSKYVTLSNGSLVGQ